MHDVVILSACRTPVGRFLGSLAKVAATELGALVVGEAVRRARIEPDQVDEVIMGNVLSAGLGQAPARQAALRAGLPHQVAALTINKVCGSGLKAVMLAGQAIRSGDAEVVVAGGMESMSRAPYLLERTSRRSGDRTLVDSMLHDGLCCAFEARSMGQLAEATARDEGITRSDQDRYALASHRNATVATAAGHFSREIVPVEITAEDVRPASVQRDECPRPNADLDQLGRLAPSFEPGGTVTAGNSSTISDGAAALIVSSRQKAQDLGRTPLATIRAWATAGLPPRHVFLAPVPAIQRVLAIASLAVGDIDLFEINEAFAAQMLACLRTLAIPEEKVNVHGGAIAIGHPIGASGARILVSLLGALSAKGGRRGLAALCLGGGNAVAMIVER